MELELSIEDLLNKRRVESDRIEFKTSWNQDDVNGKLNPAEFGK